MRPGRKLPPPFPTSSPPGSDGKVEILRWRYEAGYLLYHADDAVFTADPMKANKPPKRTYGRYWRVVSWHFKWKALVAVKKNGVSKYRMIGSFSNKEEAEAAAISHYQRFGVEVIS